MIHFKFLCGGGTDQFSDLYTDRLDGLGSGGKRKREDMSGLEDYLQLPDDYATRMSQPGKKRVNCHRAAAL